MSEEKMSRQVRRALERAGEIKTEEHEAEDRRLEGKLAAWKAERADKDKREVAAKSQGKRNIYTCDECFGHVVTVDVADGVTPFLIGCKVTPGCKGLMQSSMYRVFDKRMRADFEWYAPTKEQTVALSAGLREHASKGGLVLRPAETQ
jgi:hypothetical protein